MCEASDEVHNGLAIPKVPGSSLRERLAIANLALHSLAGIDDSSRETFEQLKQEEAKDFEITMSTSGKTFKELSARRNSIAKSFEWQRLKLALHKLLLIMKFRLHM